MRILAAADHDGVCSAKMLAMALDHRNAARRSDIAQ